MSRHFSLVAFAQGCFLAGLAYAKGNGVPKDAERAEQLRKKACEGGFEDACGPSPRTR